MARAIEYLVSLYPEKTGKEIIAIHEQEKLKDQQIFDKHNKKTLAFIKDINTNGGYFRGKFGLDQYYYYRVFNMIMNETGGVTMDVESIVLFCNNDGHKQTVCNPGEIRLERRIEEYQQLDTYSLENEERITIEEWNYINNYLNNMNSLFW